MRYVLPKPGPLKGTLEMVLGVEPQLEETTAEAFSPHRVAVYENSNGEEVAYCFADLAASASLGCALSLIPIPTAEEMIKDGSISDIAADNLYEVMNIFSSLFMNDSTEHLKLTKLEAADAINDTAAAMPGCAYRIEEARYPAGAVYFASTQ